MIFTFIAKKNGDYYGLKQKFARSKNRIRKKIIAIIHKLYQHETNSYLPLNTMILGPPNFIHGTYGVFISGEAQIGENCTIFHQVTIGSNMLYKSKIAGAPKIGDNVLIGAGAKIIGQINIGNNVRIGANYTVTRDIPDNSVVMQNEPIIVTKAEALKNKLYQKNNSVWYYRESGKKQLETDEDSINFFNNVIK